MTREGPGRTAAGPGPLKEHPGPAQRSRLLSRGTGRALPDSNEGPGLPGPGRQRRAANEELRIANNAEVPAAQRCSAAPPARRLDGSAHSAQRSTLGGSTLGSVLGAQVGVRRSAVGARRHEGWRHGGQRLGARCSAARRSAAQCSPHAARRSVVGGRRLGGRRPGGQRSQLSGRRWRSGSALGARRSAVPGPAKRESPLRLTTSPTAERLRIPAPLDDGSLGFATPDTRRSGDAVGPRWNTTR